MPSSKADRFVGRNQDNQSADAGYALFKVYKVGIRAHTSLVGIRGYYGEVLLRRGILRETVIRPINHPHPLHEDATM